ncbi:Ig-like domain-containing protein [Propionicicella superfundia]|uniref:Ig-like domain-containing protein n=1 Tax=Propionicicella superfundia TaxID=348582 RepID=UPI00041EAD55|nr:Ig-like domain-containing protein [Propionicicella superfundia]
MKTTVKWRAAAVGVLSFALLATGAGMAHAAPGDPLPVQSNGSKSSFFLYNGDFERADTNLSTVFHKGDTLTAAASPTDFLADINPSPDRPVSGAATFTEVYRFISLKNDADVAGGKNTWKAWAVDSATGPNGGTQMPSMSLESFGPQAPAVIAAGGSYWYGIAYTINNGVTTVGATYREINITAGSGDYTVGAVEVEQAPVEQKDTTTTLSADKTSVEAGSSVTLTANVSATDATVTGNVQFFEGSKSLGSVGLANGQATKSVTVSPEGEHSYTAKFVENTDFKASESAAVVVTATEPTAPVVPNAPTESALNEGTRNGATAAINENTVTLTVPASLNGTTVNVFAYSTATFLGEATVTDGQLTVDVSVLKPGEHKLAITDPTSGDILAWAAFSKTAAAVQPSIAKQINAEVAALEPADGEFSLTNLSGDTVTLADPAIVNGQSVSSGALGQFKVTDLRQVSKPGWTLGTTVQQFTLSGGTETIENSALGIAPQSVNQSGGTAEAPALSAAQVSGSATYPWNFATLAAGKYSGVTTFDADLQFTAPQGKPAGTYTSTLTLTLISE